MARPKKPQNNGFDAQTEVLEVPDDDRVLANGASFKLVQLAFDLLPKPAAQRIVQSVNTDGVLVDYISENAYHRAEAFEIMFKIMRDSYAKSIQKGSATMFPHKGKYHWILLTSSFCDKEIKGERMNPETGKPENEGMT